MLIDELYEIMVGKKSDIATSIDEFIESHYMALAAEESRKNGTVVDFDEFVSGLE
jgi:hypothetical protein